MEQIINEQALYEDTVEGVATCMGISMEEARQYVTEDFMEEVLSEMFDAQANFIANEVYYINKSKGLIK